MYRFEINNNKADHTLVVVCFSSLAVCISLFLSSVLAHIVSILIIALTGYLSWQWFKRAHPVQGVVIIDSPNCHFICGQWEINGKISAKSGAYQHSVWLYIEGFNHNQWLIINATSCDEQSFIRLKRTVLCAKVDLESR